MIFDLGFVVDAFQTGTYPVRRVPVRERDANGKLQPPETVEDTDVDASIRPAKNEELRDPEGNYATKGWSLLTRGELGLSREGYEPDFVQIDGEWFQASAEEPWQDVAGFRKVVVLIADDPPEAAP